MTPIRTLLVDDEYLALTLLAGFLSQIPDVEVVGQFTAPMKALDYLNREPVELLFLDIQMPLLSGANLLRSLRHPPVTIFTTAYSEYAVEAFDLNIADYLLKPFSFERLLRAVGRARDLIHQPTLSVPAPVPALGPAAALPDPFLTLKADGKLLRLPLADIWFIEGFGEYVRVVGPGGRVVALQTLKYLDEMLPPDQFLRIHKSYIVGIAHVSALDGNELVIGPHKIPISRDKRAEVVSRVFGGG
jgi:two-component system, LytTR family, response regulator LytT